MRKKFSMDRFHTAHTLFFCKNSPNPQTDFEKTVPAKGWRNNAMVLAIALLSFTPLRATPVPLLPGKEFRFVLPPPGYQGTSMRKKDTGLASPKK